MQDLNTPSIRREREWPPSSSESDEIEAAENQIAPVLRAQGWITLESERWKTVAAAEAVPDPSLRRAVQEAIESGVGYVLFPESGPN